MSEVATLELLDIPDEVAEILRPKRRPTLPDWMEAHYTLSAKTEALPGKWNRDYVPFMLEPMAWWADELTEQITFQACTQGGKTIFLNGSMGYAIDVDPGPGMLVMPTKEALERRLQGRLKTMFEDNPSLLRHLGGRIENFNIGKGTELDNMMLYIGWAGSDIALSDVSLRYGWIDEAALHTQSRGDVDYITLFKHRFRAYKGRWKLLVTSSPKLTGDRFDLEYEAADACQWWPQCCHCGRFHENSFDHIAIDKDPEGRFLDADRYRDEDLAHYVCPKCGAVWTEYERWQSMAAGKWCPRDGEVSDDGTIAMPDGSRWDQVPPARRHSVRVPSWLLHPSVTTIGDVVAPFVEAQQAKRAGDRTFLQDWRNNEAAEAWQDQEVATDVDVLRRHIGDYPARVVPWGVQRLSAGLDVQQDHVYLRVLGWGYMAELWSIYEARLEIGDTSKIGSWDRVEEQLTNMRFDVAWDHSRVMRLGQIAVDCRYHTDTVLDFCRASQLEVVPVAGDDSVRHASYRRRAVLGGTVMRYDLNLLALKNRLFRLYFLSDPDHPGPGYAHLHRDTMDEVLEQLTSEHRVQVREGRRHRQLWVKKTGSRANHYWDCDVYATFAAELAGYFDLAPLPEWEKEMRAETVGRSGPETNVETKPIRTEY